MSGKTPEWMPELFFCHRYEFCVVADQLGFRIGTRSDQFDTNKTGKLLEDDFVVDFVDNNFKDPDTERLCKIVDRTQAEYAVVPDVYDVDDLDDVLELGERLVEEHETTPIVVPKCTFEFDRIPDSWILGFSVPSGYAETDIPINMFTTHRTHLLGGSPRNQIKFANKAVDAGVELFSVDGNAFSKASGYGNIINEPVELLSESGYLDEKAWVKDATGYTDWGQRIAQSLARYYELWRQWSLRRGLCDDVDDVQSHV